MDGQKLPYYRLAAEDVLAELRTGKDGLDEAEAADRLKHIGVNKLQQSHGPAWPFIALRQFKNLLVLILIASACFSLYLQDVRTAAILLFIAFINTVVGFFQEYKAEHLLGNLSQLMLPQAKVLRSGTVQQINSRDLVPGDVIYVEAGDSVPADARILSETELATNDFALTGESNPTRKFAHAISGDVPLGQRQNMIFTGTNVALGNGYAVVVGTGMHTELGRIASLSQTTRADASPLQREMNNLALRITQGTVGLAIILTLVQLQANFSLNTALLFAVSIAASMIPNGLVAEINITLAQTANRLSRAKALVKKLSAVETLGATSVIATDKTGTLTKNQMTVTDTLIGKTEYRVTGTGYEANGVITDTKGRPLTGKALQDLHLFFETGALASNAWVSAPDDQHATWYVVGDPTEGALITLARKAGLDSDVLNERFPEKREYAFDSARKRMTSVREVDGRLYAFTKGAPESILERATHLWDHGHTRPLTAADRKFFADYANRHDESAERNLAFAYRVLPRGFDIAGSTIDDAEQKLTLLGIASMVDPLRDEVPAAMKAALRAHVRVCVITGDSPVIAAAIARKAGLNDGDITVVKSEELEHLNDTQITDLLARGGAVFSRVSPEDKLRIVQLARAHREVVAVTGDGINDAPALKRADIGVAMGLAGTDVAKDAAEIVLLDDSFGTLVTAMEQGRVTFQNIKKAARCALTDNMSELITVLLSLAVTAVWHVPAAITAIQILAIDLVAQMFPITALGWDPATGNLMRDKPRNLTDHILNRKTVFEFIGFGTLAAALAYANYMFFFTRHHISPINLSTTTGPYFEASILTYVTIVLCQFMNLLLVRSNNQLFTAYLWSNKKLLAAFGISAVCILNIVYNPVIQPWFRSAGLSVADWMSAFGVAAIYTAMRLFHLHTKATGSRELIRKHGADRVRAHLAKAIS